jgi:hypothetical protein
MPKPVAQAVMFCLMDVSGSMFEHMKDLAKRFYMLLYVFLTRRYRHVEIVFIRHTNRAEEVDEDTFFHGPASAECSPWHGRSFKTSRLVLGLTLMLACSLRVLDALRLGQPQYALVVLGNGAIAFARGFLELGPVDYRETTPRTTDDAVVLEQSSNPNHRRPVHPQHLSEIFLREWKLVAGNAVLGH